TAHAFYICRTLPLQSAQDYCLLRRKAEATIVLSLSETGAMVVARCWKVLSTMPDRIVQEACCKKSEIFRIDSGHMLKFRDYFLYHCFISIFLTILQVTSAESRRKLASLQRTENA
ncbi:MAG: hypothetical protein KA199_08820, partial [Sphingorhabdus sp.]|nr:hypothetical protein [Sphingorhabdus sp.]